MLWRAPFGTATREGETMTVRDQAAEVEAVIGDGTNDTSAQWFTMATGNKVHALDSAIFAEIYQRGGYVRLKPDGGDLFYIFSTSNTQNVDLTLAPSDAGTTDSDLAGHVRAGQTEPVYVPPGHIYFARRSDFDNADVLVERG